MRNRPKSFYINPYKVIALLMVATSSVVMGMAIWTAVEAVF